MCVCSAEDLIVNCEALSKEKLEIRDGDLLEIFPADDQSKTWKYVCLCLYVIFHKCTVIFIVYLCLRSHLILKVKTLSPEIQSKGTLYTHDSFHHDLSENTHTLYIVL